MRTATAATAVVILALLAGCSGNEPSEHADNASTTETAAVDQSADDAYLAHASLARGLSFPMDAYRITDADQRILDEARNVLVKRCMKRYGFDHEPSMPSKGPKVGPYVYLYGVDDPVLAAEHGYLHPTDLDPDTYAPVPEADLSSDEELALYGDQKLDGADIPDTLEAAEAMTGPELNGGHVPITGCAGEASLTINRPGEGWVDPTSIFRLENEAGALADKDERVERIARDWSACMAEHGYKTASPLTARDDLGLSGDVSGDKAIDAAVQDVACKSEVRLIDRWSAVDAEYQEKVIEEHADTLGLYETQHERRMAAARAVLR